MAYAALRSLVQILHQTLNRDHQYLILDEKQQIESLIEKLSSIQEALENPSKKLTQHLERIRDASYIAEDIIESHITDRILSQSVSHEDGILEKISIRFDIIENWIVSSTKPSSCTPTHRMRFLSDSESWILFCDKVFGNICCPPNLEEIGKKIVQHCQGLSLAIVLIGGLLSKATRTEHYWKYVAENVSSETTSIDEQCFKILSLSYKHLPSHLKWCFLYMGIFPEDYNIHVSKLVKLWVAEEIVKPVRSKSLEDVAEEYFMDLVERNLILIHEKRSNGKIKTFKIHDLVRRLCVSEAEKENFFHLTNGSLHGMLRVSIHRNTKSCDDEVLSSPQVWSLLNFDREVPVPVPVPKKSIKRFLFLSLFRKRQKTLLRVLHQQGRFEFPNEVAEWVDLRYLDCISMHIPSSISKLQNLQTIILRRDMKMPLYLSIDIWKMPQLRHVLLEYVIMPDPSSVGTEGDRSVFVLENLQTLSLVKNFRCTEEVIKRIPNIKKLGILYEDEEVDREYLCPKNLVHLRKLESLKWIKFGRLSFLMNLNFPTSLKKFTLVGVSLSKEDISIVGSLPNLQVLKLRRTAFFDRAWITNAGEFLQLKYLLLEGIALGRWRVDCTHFPNLESLVLEDCDDFGQIPDEIREIPTLRSIELNGCCGSVLTSAMYIQMKHRRSGGDGPQVLIVNSRNRIEKLRRQMFNRLHDPFVF